MHYRIARHGKQRQGSTKGRTVYQSPVASSIQLGNAGKVRRERLPPRPHVLFVRTDDYLHPETGFAQLGGLPRLTNRREREGGHARTE